jgi:hypothetical protein
MREQSPRKKIMAHLDKASAAVDRIMVHLQSAQAIANDQHPFLAEVMPTLVTVGVTYKTLLSEARKNI